MFGLFESGRFTQVLLYLIMRGMGLPLKSIHVDVYQQKGSPYDYTLNASSIQFDTNNLRWSIVHINGSKVRI